jgi:hypothetical protein
LRLYIDTTAGSSPHRADLALRGKHRNYLITAIQHPLLGVVILVLCTQSRCDGALSHLDNADRAAREIADGILMKTSVESESIRGESVRAVLTKCGKAPKGVMSLRHHWQEYVMEAGELGLYVFLVCRVTTLLQHPTPRSATLSPPPLSVEPSWDC